MKSIIENGILKHFDIEDLKNSNSPFNVHRIKKDGNMVFEITIPDIVEEIGENAFDLDFPYVLNIPSSVLVIKKEAFKNNALLQINFSSGLKEIGSQAFKGCKIKNLKLPEGLESVGENAFKLCPLKEVSLPLSIKNLDCGFDGNIEKLSIGGKSFTQNNFAFSKLNTTWHFIKYAVANKKFIPRNESIMMDTKPENLPAFFVHAKDWQEVISLAERINGKELKKLEQDRNFLYNTTSYEYQMYKISVILGLFDDQNSSVAKNFLLKQITKLKPYHCFYCFADIEDTKYNPDFTNFVINNYTPPVVDPETDLDICFLSRVNSAGEVDHCFAEVYNNWNIVRVKYPNKSIMKKRETGSKNNNLSIEDVFNALYSIKYTNCLPGNEKLVKAISGYGYDQASFEKLQALYNLGKELAKDPESLPLEKIIADKAECGIRYELLKKDDPETLILGDETSCCQRLKDVGESCLIYGVLSKNSGFVKFSLNGQIIAQSWVWYNEKTKHVCLDNIEIPVLWKKRMKRIEMEKEFNRCLIRLADSIMNGMNKEEIMVKSVSVGKGHIDFDGIKRYPGFVPESNYLPDDYNGYTDAYIQYRIDGVRMEDIYFGKNCDYEKE